MLVGGRHGTVGGRDNLTEQVILHGFPHQNQHILAGDAVQLGQTMGVGIVGLGHAQLVGLVIHHLDEGINVTGHMSSQGSAGLIAGNNQEIVHQIPDGDFLAGLQMPGVHPVAVLFGNGLGRNDCGTLQRGILLQNQQGGHDLGHTGGGVGAVRILGQHDGAGGLFVQQSKTNIGDAGAVFGDDDGAVKLSAVIGKGQTGLTHDQQTQQQGKNSLQHGKIPLFSIWVARNGTSDKSY